MSDEPSKAEKWLGDCAEAIMAGDTGRVAELAWKNPRGEMPVYHGVTLRLVEKETDYPIVAQWWQAHGWEPIPAQRLPMLGVIATVKEIDTAAGWCYMDNSGSGVAMIEWLVSNPLASPRSIAIALRYVIEWLMWRAAEPDLRFTFFLGTCRQPALSKLMEKSGFQVTDRDVIHLCCNN